MAQIIRTGAGFLRMHWSILSAQVAAPMAESLWAARLGPLLALRLAPGGTYQVVAAKGIIFEFYCVRILDSAIISVNSSCHPLAGLLRSAWKSASRNMAFAIIVSEDSYPDLRIGGLPTHGIEADWPLCRTHKEPLMFVAQVPLNLVSPDDDRVLLLFQCQFDPGLCDDWEPFSGDNAAIIVNRSKPMKIPQLPSDDSIIELMRYGDQGRTPVGVISTVIIDYQEVVENGEDSAWWSFNSESDYYVAGKTGHPTWIQGDDEVPKCPKCTQKMDFVIQLNEISELNFCGEATHTA